MGSGNFSNFIKKCSSIFEELVKSFQKRKTILKIQMNSVKLLNSFKTKIIYSKIFFPNLLIIFRIYYY